jgi:hypothetical protein
VRLALSGHEFMRPAIELIGGAGLAELRERVRCVTDTVKTSESDR